MRFAYKNGQTQVVCQARSMRQSKGHFHLRGFGAVMLLRLTINVKKRAMCQRINVLRGYTPLVITTWRKSNLRVWTEAEFWKWRVWILPSWKALMPSFDSVPWFRSSLFVDTPEDRSSRGLAFAPQGLLADSQISSFFSCSSNKACFQLIRAPTPMGRYFTSSDIQLNWNTALKRILERILKWNYWDDTSRDK